MRDALETPGGHALYLFLSSIAFGVALPPSSSEAEIRNIEGWRRCVHLMKRIKETPRG